MSRNSRPSQVRSCRTCRSAWRGRPEWMSFGSLALRALRHPQVGLAHLDPVPPGQAHQDLDATVQQLAVGRVRHRLGLHGGVDGHPPQVLLLDRPAALGGGQALGQQQFQPFGADPLAPARHRGAVQRQRVPEAGLAAEQLDVGAVQVARADRLVGKAAVHVLEQVQPDHEARRQPGAAGRVRVERPERRLEPAPLDQPGQPNQRVPRVHQVRQPRAEQVFLRLSLRRLGAHRRAGSLPGDAADQITSDPAPQRTDRFASLRPLIRAEPAKPDTSPAPENRRNLPLSAYFTADEHYLGSSSWS